MTKEYQWSEDTLNYFKDLASDFEYDYLRDQVTYFVERWVYLKKNIGIPEEELVNDLINKIYNYEEDKNIIESIFKSITNMTKENLIQSIWGWEKDDEARCTHNDQDYKDLQEFSVDELKEILNDLKN